jgi:hypothetical protein
VDEDIFQCLDTPELREYTKNMLEGCMIDAGQEVLKICPVECEATFMENLSQKA